MNPNEQRLAIATHLGWTEISYNPKTDLYYGKPPKDHTPPWDVLIPDYLNDLNSMHEAEKTLNAGQINTYLGHLYRNAKVANSESNPWEIIAVRVATHATATQRAEAFLLTLNLWKEN